MIAATPKAMLSGPSHDRVCDVVGPLVVGDEDGPYIRPAFNDVTVGEARVPLVLAGLQRLPLKQPTGNTSSLSRVGLDLFRDRSQLGVDGRPGLEKSGFGSVFFRVPIDRNEVTTPGVGVCSLIIAIIPPTIHGLRGLSLGLPDRWRGCGINDLRLDRLRRRLWGRLPLDMVRDHLERFFQILDLALEALGGVGTSFPGFRRDSRGSSGSFHLGGVGLCFIKIVFLISEGPNL